MNFSSFPKRSSSDDDALDQALNAWARREHHHRPSEPAEESPGSAHFAATRRDSELVEESSREAQLKATNLATDPLEFHRWAEDTRRSDPAATGPAAGTWNRVLRSTAQAKSRGGDMSSVAMSTEPQSASIQDVPKFNRRSISRYLNYAASLVIVFGVAFAGAFMAMQINQPDGSDGNFALFGQSESETCDVEPMTIDEALAIVENPFGDSDQDEPYLSRFVDLQRRWVMVATDGPATPHNYVDQSLIESFQNPPDEDSFGVASERMNGFLACGQNGTVGQLFQFIRPFEIQRIVLTGLPVYRDEEAVRSALEELLPMQASELVAASDSAFASSEYVFMANPNLDDAAGIKHTYRYGMSETIMMGVTVTDQNGEIVFQNDYHGRTNPAGPLITTDRMRVIMGKSLIDEQWYVLAVISE